MVHISCKISSDEVDILEPLLMQKMGNAMFVREGHYARLFKEDYKDHVRYTVTNVSQKQYWRLLALFEKYDMWYQTTL